MPDQRYPQLPDGGQPQDNDVWASERGGTSGTPGTAVALFFSNIRAWLEARFAPKTHSDITAGNPHGVTAALSGADPAGTAASLVTTHDNSGASHDGINALTTDGDLLTRDAGVYARLGVGLNGQLLTARPLNPTGKAQWEDPPVQLGFLAFTFSSNTNTAQDPGPGAVRVNSALWATVTQTAIDDLDSTGLNLRGLLLTFEAGDTILFRQDSDPSKTAAYTLSTAPVAQTGYVQFNLTFISEGTGGIADDGEAISIWHERANQGGATVFTALTDTPADYTASSGKFVAVTGAETGLEFVDPPTGTGDVSSSGTTDNVVQLGSSVAKGIKDSTFLASDVALKDAPNSFTASQAIVVDGAPAIMTTIANTAGPSDDARFDALPGNGTINNRRFSFRASGGSLHIEPQNDAGTPSGQAVLVSHAGAMTLGNPTGGMPPTVGFLNVEQVQENGQRVYSPANPQDSVPNVGTVDGDLIPFDGTQYYKLAVGLDGQQLTARPGGALGAKLVWETPATGAVDSVFTRTGDVVAQAGDYTASQVTNAADVTAANVFTTDQQITSAAGDVAVEVRGAVTSHIYWTPQTGTINQRAFSFSATNGDLFLQSRADNLGFVANVLTVDHAGGMAVGSPTGGLPAAGNVNAQGLLVNDVAAAVTLADTTDGTVVLGDTGANAIKSSTIAEAALVLNNLSTTIGAGVGQALTNDQVASSATPYTPDPLNGQWVELTGNTDQTINAVANDGPVRIYVPAAIATVTLSGYTTVPNVRPTPLRDSVLEVSKQGTRQTALWV